SRPLRARRKALHYEPHPEVHPAPDPDGCAQEDDPYEAKPRDLVVPHHRGLKDVSTEDTDRYVADESDHQQDAQSLDDHVGLPRCALFLGENVGTELPAALVLVDPVDSPRAPPTRMPVHVVHPPPLAPPGVEPLLLDAQLVSAMLCTTL